MSHTIKRPSSIDPQERRDARRIKAMASTITDQATLDKLLAGAPLPQRLAMVERLLPYLPFCPQELAQARAMDAISVGDCPSCGLRRGAVIPHECDGAAVSDQEAN